MPYQWDQKPGAERELTLWPHRSLPRRGYVWFIGGTWAMLMVPALAVVGTMVLWGLLPFLVLTLWLTMHFINRSYRDGELRETLTLTPKRAELIHAKPGKPELRWDANAYWVEVEMRRDGGPVENYLTLRGNGRIVELGAFLSPDERKSLHGELQTELSRIRSNGTPSSDAP